MAEPPSPALQDLSDHPLKTDKLGLTANTNPAVVGYYLWNNTLAKATIVAYYKREKK